MRSRCHLSLVAGMNFEHMISISKKEDKGTWEWLLTEIHMVVSCEIF